jgi:hypothetical protein
VSWTLQVVKLVRYRQKASTAVNKAEPRRETAA